MQVSRREQHGMRAVLFQHPPMAYAALAGRGVLISHVAHLLLVKEPPGEVGGATWGMEHRSFGGPKGVIGLEWKLWKPKTLNSYLDHLPAILITCLVSSSPASLRASWLLISHGFLTAQTWPELGIPQRSQATSLSFVFLRILFLKI